MWIKITCIFLIILAGIIAVAPDDAFAYDAITHQALTQEIVRFYNLLHPNAPIDDVSLQDILKGSVEEDAPPRWINHFYNPLTKTGWTGDKMGALPSSVVRLFSFIGISSEEALSAIDWIKNNIIQDKYASYGENHTWKTGLKEYATGKIDGANQTLGHILHIFEDLGVPDHTRDDTHAQELSAATGDEGSPYESYATRFAPQTFSLAKTLYDKHAPIITKQTPEEYLESMAAYSNLYFFSKDTINSPDFPSPRVSESDCDSNGYCYGKDGNDGKITLALKDKTRANNNTTTPIYSIKSTEIYYPILESYFSHLSKQIVVNGAGLVELFYQQGKDEKENQQYPQPLVTYDFSFITPPAFSLVGTGEAIVSGAQSLWGAVASTAQGTMAWAQNFWNRFSGSGTFDSLALIPPETSTTSQTQPSQPENNSVPPVPANSANAPASDHYAPPPPQPNAVAVYATRVIDGDTIVLSDGTVVRYIGIDAPEVAYQQNAAGCYADQARDKNKLLVQNTPLRLEYDPAQATDKYDRTLAYVWAGNTLVNRELVAGGYAYAYNFDHPHPKEADFLSAQNGARDAQLGLWGPACPHKTATTTAADNMPGNTATAATQSSTTTHCLFSSSNGYNANTGMTINEIAWMGSTQGATKEWIELKNRGNASLSTRGWAIIAQDDSLTAPLPSITVAPGQIILLERTDDTPVPDKKADAFFTGAIKNSDTALALVDESCRVVDTAGAHPSWPAGDATSRRTMERDWNGGWYTSAAPNGTPGKENEWGYGGSGSGGGTSGGGGGTSTTTPPDLATTTATEPQWAPVTINEIYYDAPGTDENREWLELYNAGTSSVALDGWKIEESGTAHAIVPHGSTGIDPGGYAIIARDQEQFLLDHPDITAPLWTSAFSLNNGGEAIALKNDTLLIDATTYASTTGAAGNGKSLQKFDAAWKEADPTPGKENKEDAPSGQSAMPLDHLVISEMQAAGQSVDDEFIEIYNPTNAAVSLRGYSVQYISGKATTTEGADREIFADTAAVAAHGFFLLARNGGSFATRADVSYDGFSLSGSATGGIVVLTRATGTIDGLGDSAIVDMLAYGAPALAIDDAAPLPPAGQSIERKSLESGTCHEAKNASEFSGNGCNTDNAVLDFDVRQTPKPQSTTHLPEPRSAPPVPEHLSASFETSSLALSLSWDAVNALDIAYRISDGASPTASIIATTTQPSWRTSLHAVRYDATFLVDACDKEDFCSDKASTTIAIPSPLTSFAVYKDPRADDRYAVDMTYAAYPFVPNLYASPKNGRWKIMALYLNQDAPQTPDMTDDHFKNLSDTLAVSYPQCAGGTANASAILMPDTPSNCSVNGGLYNSSMGFGVQQTTHLDLALVQTPQNFSLSPDDFITVAFYDFYDFMPSDGTVGYFKLAAVDKTHYHIADAPPAHQPPALSGDIAFSFNQTTSGVTASWPPATDPDTPQNAIRYEIRYHPDDPWIDTGRAASHATTTAPGDVLEVAVQAVDDFKNTSSELSASWTYPTTTPTIIQTVADGWSNVFGQKNQNNPPWQAPGPAVFQSITPHAPLSFNTIAVRIQQKNAPTFVYPATLKLGIYTDSAGAINWSEKVGEAFSAELRVPDPTNDITFVFSPAVTLEQEKTYWLALEIAAYNASYQDYAWQCNEWRVATASTNPYPDGIMAYGWGNPCTDPSSCAPGTIQPSAGTDWYMIFATRE